MGNQRARSDSEKALKRDLILTSAWKLFEETGGNLPTAMDIAEHAGISKGTVYIYFKTKEEIFLDLFLEKVEEWVNDAGERLNHSDNKNTANVAVALAQFPIENPLIMHLGSLLHSVLEKNAPTETVLEMKLQMASVVEECGLMLHNIFPHLTPKDGANTMLTLYALFNGLFQMTSSSERLKEELENRNIDIFNINYAEAMISAATIFLEGMQTIKKNELRH